VRPERAIELVREGHRLRIYVPYGPRWYEYSLRRLRENPRLATAIALGLLRRG
jgi:proline dehydrogenase